MYSRNVNVESKCERLTISNIYKYEPVCLCVCVYKLGIMKKI